MRRFPFLFAGIAAIAAGAFAQQNVERFERTLEQIQRDLMTRRAEDIPLEQRALIDYGAYFSLSYLSIDDRDHENHILRRSTVPSPLSPDGAKKCFEIARAIAEALDYVGVLGVELFIGRNGEIAVNEIAPRVHNSGHWTMEAC